LALEKEGLLRNAVLIPVDTHIDIFSQNKKRNIEEEVTVKRSDLILVYTKNGKLILNLIEVKFRSGEGSITESLTLKEEICKKNENSEKAFRTKFISDDENIKIDIQIANKSLSTLIGFYLERSIRNGFCTCNSDLFKSIDRINKGDFEIEFEKSGYIIHWAGVTKPVDIYNGNKIYELGKDLIKNLLEIRETEIEDDLDVKADEKTTTISPIKEPNPKVDEINEQPEPAIYIPVKEIPKVNIKNKASDETINEVPSIVLGKNIDNKQEVIFNPVTQKPKKLANQHVLIVGTTGAGKSQTTSGFLYELNLQNVPFLILDFQGEYISDTLTKKDGTTFIEATNSNEFDPSRGMNINPLELSTNSSTGEKVSYMNNVYQVSGILKQIFGLGDIQHPLLKDAIKRAYQEKGFSISDRNTWNNEPPQFHDIWTILEFMEQNEGKNVKNLKYRIEELFENNIFTSPDEGFSISEILNQNSIINLSTLPTSELMKSVARFVLQSVYNRMLSEGPSKEIKLYVVIDEAHKLSYDQTLTELIREARKYGVGFILASQSVRDFDTVVFENMGTKIALQLEGETAKFMAENFGVMDRTIKESVMRMLPVQKNMRALIRNNHYEPFAQVDIVPFFEK